MSAPNREYGAVFSIDGVAKMSEELAALREQNAALLRDKERFQKMLTPERLRILREASDDAVRVHQEFCLSSDHCDCYERSSEIDLIVAELDAAMQQEGKSE